MSRQLPQRSGQSARGLPGGMTAGDSQERPHSAAGSDSQLGMRTRWGLAKPGVLVAALLGSNPWPATGWVGHLALALMSLEALGLVLAYAFAAWSGYVGVMSTDFIAYFTGAAMLANGEGYQLYQPKRQWEVQQALLAAAGASSPTLITYINPPLWAALVVPFLPLGLRAASMVWGLVSLAVSLGILLVVGRQASDRPGVSRAAALCLCFAPFLEAWYFGQMAALMLVAFGGWFALARSHRPYLAGLVLSLSLLKPQYLPFMVVFLAWNSQWRQLAGLGAGAVVQGVLTLLLLIHDGRPPSVEALLPYAMFGGGQHNVLVELQLNIRALIWHALPGLPAAAQSALLVGMTLVAMAAFLLALGRAWRPEHPAFAWQALAVFAMAQITAFHNNLLHLYLLLPPLVALVALPSHIRGDSRAGPGLGLLLAIPAIGILLGLSLNPSFYYVAGWLTVLGAIGLGLAAYRQTGHPSEAS